MPVLQCDQLLLGIPVAAPQGLSLRVDGAVIVVLDIYDRPLATIYQGIQRYWESR